MANHLMWANRFGSNVPTLNGIHCIYIYTYIFHLCVQMEFQYIIVVRIAYNTHLMFALSATRKKNCSIDSTKDRTRQQYKIYILLIPTTTKAYLAAAVSRRRFCLFFCLHKKIEIRTRRVPRVRHSHSIFKPTRRFRFQVRVVYIFISRKIQLLLLRAQSWPPVKGLVSCSSRCEFRREKKIHTNNSIKTNARA